MNNSGKNSYAGVTMSKMPETKDSDMSLINNKFNINDITLPS